MQPASILRVYLKPRNIPALQAREALLQRTPRIAADLSGEELVINPQCLQDEEVQAVIDGLNAVL